MGATPHSANRDSRALSAYEKALMHRAVGGLDHNAMHRRARAESRARARYWRSLSPAAQRRMLRSQEPAASKATHETVGRWGSGIQIPLVPVHSIVLPTGRVLWIDGLVQSKMALWDPATGSVKSLAPPANLFCAGHTLLPDGRVLVVGGSLARRTSTTFWKAHKTVYTFNPWTEAWTRHGDMRRGRWYPSVASFADGRSLILGGSDETGSFVDEDASFGATTANPYLNPDIELFAPSTGATTLVGHRGASGEPPNGYWYPHMFLMPSGRLLIAGARPWDTWMARPPTSTGMAWTNISNHAGRYEYSTAVLAPGSTSGSSRVMIQGGGAKPAHPYAQMFDEANPSAGWTTAPRMRVGRMHHNTVLLPDSSMVTVGGGNNSGLYGTSSAHRQIELYDPATRTWRLGPAQAEDRAYHSTAVLLPDGRVLSAGDTDASDHGGQGQNLDRIEIYSPPYLFKGTRPTIRSAPAAVRWGAGFTVSTNGVRAVLVAPGAATHATNTGQRVIPLRATVRADGTGVDVIAPDRATIAPPGYYMLFVLNNNGVPSVARWMQLRADAPATVVNP